MEDLEQSALWTAGPVKPQLWKRYVDDVFSIWKMSTEGLLAHVNSIDDQITFTIEREEITSCLSLVCLFDVMMVR